MSREILFRGKRTDNNEWAYGIPIDTESEGGFKEFIVSHAKWESDDNSIDFLETDVYEVNPRTIGQYTGLTDKHGKKIFEGDIVNLFNMQGKIVFEEGAFGIAIFQYIDWDLLDKKVPFNNHPCFCYNDNFVSLWELYWNFEQDDNLLYEVEVIGNIYDNPELLKGAEIE